MQAYLRADEKVLQQHCSPENVERLTSIVKAEQAQVIASLLIHSFVWIHTLSQRSLMSIAWSRSFLRCPAVMPWQAHPS